MSYALRKNQHGAGKEAAEGCPQATQGNQLSKPVTATVPVVQAKYLPRMVLSCAPYLLGAQSGDLSWEVLTTDCPIHNQEGGSCKYKNPGITVRGLEHLGFGIPGLAPIMNGTCGFNLSVLNSASTTQER